MNAHLSLRMCPECGIAFEPSNYRNVYCSSKCRNAYCRTHPFDRSPRKCQQCDTEFSPVSDWHVYCSEPCKEKAQYIRERANPAEIEKNKARSKAWYKAHRDEHLSRMRAVRLAKTSKEKPVEGIDPWLLPSPELDRLPGGFISLDMRPFQKFEHWQLSSLHGVMTSLTGGHQPHVPRFALLPWPRGIGWAVYVGDDATAEMVAGKTHCLRLGDKTINMMCGPLVRVKLPHYRPGVYKVRIDAITPIHIRAYGSSVVRVAPNSRHLRGTLEGFMPRRLGIDIPPNTVRLELVDGETSQSYVPLAGRIHDFGKTAGWVGGVTVETNAVGRFILQACALGMGYGGKVAFGFGRIRVTDL